MKRIFTPDFVVRAAFVLILIGIAYTAYLYYIGQFGA
jgi:hypothetical protein